MRPEFCFLFKQPDFMQPQVYTENIDASEFRVESTGELVIPDQHLVPTWELFLNELEFE